MEQVKHAPYGKLVNELYKNLSLQAQNPDKIVETRFEVSFDQTQEEINEETIDTIITKLNQGVITNCLFKKSGKELFKGTKDDGRAHLMMQFKVDFKSEAQNSLAICYAKGQGVQQDDEEAVRLWKKAAEMGNSAAETNLKIHKEGNAYLKERVRKQKELTLPKNYRESSRNFSLKSTFMENKKAAEQGNAEAQYNLGQYYEIGVDVDEDEKMAFEWYSKAAKQGLVEAQDALGRCYHNGIGVEKNDEKAVEWWLKAAGQGNVEAQNSLGICYAKGRGVKQDYEKAVMWWKKAADQGDFAAKYNLQFYENYEKEI